MSAEELQAENARLKAEVERLRKAGDALGDSIEIYRLKAEVDLWKLRSDNWQKLVQVTKAEVERLRASSFVTSVPAAIYERLVHRIEALREAGDGLWYCLRHNGSVSPEERIDAAQDWIEARDNLK